MGSCSRGRASWTSSGKKGNARTMRRIGDNIEGYVASLMGDDEQARINYRAQQVRNRYRLAIESVYRENAELFLAHTNNVYILKKDGVLTLIVYVDESIFAAELNAQRELIKLKLLQLFGEQVEQFEIHVSRGNYKDYHPYADEHAPEGDSDLPLAPLSEEEREAVEATARMVDDERVRKALEKAMSADLERKKAENGIGS